VLSSALLPDEARHDAYCRSEIDTVAAALVSALRYLQRNADGILTPTTVSRLDPVFLPVRVMQLFSQEITKTHQCAAHAGTHHRRYPSVL
jgi:hypothetical protein